MSSPSRKRATKKIAREEPVGKSRPARVQDSVSLLRSANKRLEDAMRLLAEATLLNPELDEQLGIEAQRLIGVRKAVQAELKALEARRLRERS